MSEPIAKYIKELKERMEIPQDLLKEIQVSPTKGEAKRRVKAYLQGQETKVEQDGKAKKRG